MRDPPSCASPRCRPPEPCQRAPQRRFCERCRDSSRDSPAFADWLSVSCTTPRSGRGAVAVPAHPIMRSQGDWRKRASMDGHVPSGPVNRDCRVSDRRVRHASLPLRLPPCSAGIARLAEDSGTLRGSRNPKSCSSGRWNQAGSRRRFTALSGNLAALPRPGRERPASDRPRAAHARDRRLRRLPAGRPPARGRSNSPAPRTCPSWATSAGQFRCFTRPPGGCRAGTRRGAGVSPE